MCVECAVVVVDSTSKVRCTYITNLDYDVIVSRAANMWCLYTRSTSGIPIIILFVYY